MTHTPIDRDMKNAQTDASAGRAIWRRLRARLRSENGAFLTEYAIAVPFLFTFIFITLELSYLKVREVALDRAMDRSFRELRLGLIDDPTHQKLKDRICADEISFMLPDCGDNLKLQLVPLRANTLTPGFDPDLWDASNPLGGVNDDSCVDLTPEEGITPVFDFEPGGQNDLVLARVCLFQRPIFPPTQWGLDVLDPSRNPDAGDQARNFRLFSVSAFVNEPT